VEIAGVGASAGGTVRRAAGEGRWGSATGGSRLASRVRGIIQAFHRNGMDLFPRFFCTKLVRRVRQLLCRPCVAPDAVEPDQAAQPPVASRGRFARVIQITPNAFPQGDV